MDNVIENKSFHFAIRIVKLCNYLHSEKKEYTLSIKFLKAERVQELILLRLSKLKVRKTFSQKLIFR